MKHRSEEGRGRPGAGGSLGALRGLRRLPAGARELPERYEPVRVIGTGGMGMVLLARDRGRGRLVAIKTLRTDCSDLLRRLRHEARILGELRHPSIVSVHDVAVHAGRLFLAMEYASGGNLALARLRPEELLQVVRGVVDGLAHAHARGVVHRDVKPENVLLTRRAGARHALLSDFGLACGVHEGSPELRRLVVGTPLTMSPEQVRGETLGPASDVFSLGVTLYRQLTGRWPFRGRDLADVFEAIEHAEPDPLGERCAAGFPVPRGLGEVLLRSLAKRPADRFGSMDEMGAALDRVLRPRGLFRLSLPRRSAREPEPTRIHPTGDRQRRTS